MVSTIYFKMYILNKKIHLSLCKKKFYESVTLEKLILLFCFILMIIDKNNN